MKSCDVINGSDVIYRHLGGYKYHIKYILYHQCVCKLGILPKFTISCKTTSITHLPKRISIRDITPVCSSGQPPCGSQSGGRFGIEEHIFEDTVDFSTAPYNALLSNNCCEIYLRITQPWGLIGTTTTTTNYGGEAMLNLCNIGKKGNNSPSTSNIPITFMCCNQPFGFNNGIADNIDDDSLSFELAEPLSSSFAPVNWVSPLNKDIPLTPYCGTPGKVNCNPIPNAKPPRGFYFDKSTGDMILTPVNCSESGPVAIKINEYRKDSATKKYIQLGYTRRDIFVTVLQCPNNNPPQIISKPPPAVCEGDKICFTINTKDDLYLPFQTIPDTVQLTWNGGIPGATFRIIDPTAREKSAEFCWQTKVGDARDFAYQFTATAKDDACPRPAISVKGFRVMVKVRAQSKRKYDLLDCGKLRFTSFPKDTVNYTGQYLYEWTIRDSTNSGIPYYKSFKKLDSFKFKRGGKYIITHKINNTPDCPTTYQDTVIIPPVLDVELAFGKDTFVCAGDSLLIKPIIAYGYLPFKFHWESPIGSFKAKDTLDRFAIKPTFSTTIMLKVTDKNKCVDADSIKVHYQPLPVVNIGPDRRICTYNNITLDAQNADTMRYFWQPDGDSTRLKTINVAGKYFVKVIDPLGCHRSDTMELFVNDTVVAIAKPDREICILDTLKVKADRRPKGYTRSMSWTDLNTGLTMANDSSFKVKITQTVDRSYDLYLRVIQSGVSCEDRDTLNIKVNKLPTFISKPLDPHCFTDGAINLTFQKLGTAVDQTGAKFPDIRYFQRYKKPSWVTGGPVGSGPYIYDYPKFITNAQVPVSGLKDTICYEYTDYNKCYNYECKPVKLNPNPLVHIKNGIFCQKAGLIWLDNQVDTPFNKAAGIQSFRCIDIPDGSGVDPDAIITEDQSFIPSHYYMDPGQEGENQKTGNYLVEYCFKNPSTSCQRCDTATITVVRLPEIQFDPIPSQCINYPQLALDSFVTEKNSGQRFASGKWSCVAYGGSRDMSNTDVNNAINNSVKTFKYFDPSTVAIGGQYLLKFFDNASGCPVSDSVEITVYGLPPVILFKPDTVCSSGGLVALGSNYQPNDINGKWSGPFVTGSNFDPSQSPRSIQYEGPYTLTYAYTNPQTKCTNTKTTLRTIQSQPEVKIENIKPYQLCEDSIFTVWRTKKFAKSTTWSANGDGLTATPFLWKTTYTHGVQDTVGNNVIMTVSTDPEGFCPPVTDNITLQIEPYPQFVLGAPFIGCEPATVDFASYVSKPNGSSNLRYSWYYGNGDSLTKSTNGNPQELYPIAKEGWYDVRVVVQNQWGALPTQVCSTPRDIPAYVKVMPQPKANFSSDPEFFTTVAFTKFKFFDQTQIRWGKRFNLWNFNEGVDPDDTSTQANPVHTYPADTTTYWVHLYTEYRYDADNYCWDTVGQLRKVGPDVTVFVPTAFSPEGTGPKKNNVFNAVVNGEKSFHIEIFNRWGEKLWESDDKYESWNGKFKEEDCQQDVYAWSVRVTDYKGEEYRYEGTVSLLR